MKPARFAAVTTVFLASVFGATVDGQTVPNADFTEGDQSPDGWKLQGGQGRWVDKNILEVTGDGTTSSYWRCDGYEFEPGKLYRFEFRARRPGGSGCVISGPSFANRDYSGLSTEWKWYGHVFRAPDKTDGAHLRIGQWHATGTVQFDAVRVVPAIPVHTQVGDSVLGEGESIRDGRYAFHGTFGGDGSNYHRTLVSATAGFNSYRWCFGGGSQVTYKFELPGCKLRDGRVRFNVGHHARGGCTAEVSRDGKSWRALTTQKGLGTGEAALPADLLPAETLLLRLRASAPGSSFQVDRVEFEAELDRKLADDSGQTVYAHVKEAPPGIAFGTFALRADRRGGTKHIVAEIRNETGRPLDSLFSWESVTPGGLGGLDIDFFLDKGKRHTEGVPLDFCPAGENTLLFTWQLTDAVNNARRGKARVSVTLTVPDLYRADYGELLSADRGLWWCDATHKVARGRSLPDKQGTAVRLAACRNDREAVQVVVRPKEPLKGLTATAGPLAGPDGATIPAENVKILRVYYHYVDHPTDKTGVRDWWPDALPPLDKPIDVEAGQNQPLWVLVHVPKDAQAGDYSGTVKLKADGFAAGVPIKLHVWDFTLPERNHLKTNFGLSTGNIFRYHGLKTEADKRKVLDMYFQCFAEHRISPYDPAPLDPIRVKFLPDADPPHTEVDFSAFDPAFDRAIEKYHFTGFRLPVRGMGGGTFHKRWEPKIGKYGEKTPQYQAVFSSYMKQLENHFRKKGWLDMPYIYWFDEPAPRDYEFVTKGFERLKRYAPDLRRMLTEQPGDDLKAPVDIWCPVSHNYDAKEAAKCRARGAKFWWYVCCGPKAPYCTLFIDHPATELRIWHWQAWQRDIVGTLVWTSNYWTSSAAYPDKAQNPYEDPMGYVSGYSTPKGVKRYWGNGDGRFIYPPLAAAVPGKSGPGPVIAPPVSSIRWEMLREGVEDYEYLYMLRDLLAKRRGELSPEQLKRYDALLEVPESITKDMTTFTTDPSPIYARRAEVAEAIERLSK